MKKCSRTSTRIHAGLLGLMSVPALMATPAVAGEAGVSVASRSPVLAPVARFTRPDETLLAGGQPSPEAWRKLEQAGIRTIINLRPDSELPGRDEAAEVADAGLDYRHLPIAGTHGITMVNADALWRMLDESEGAVALHCASGNRVGALLALGAAQRGMDAEAAIAFGRKAGLGSAETRVRELLAAPRAR